jgi:hypothetical protein
MRLSSPATLTVTVPTASLPAFASASLSARSSAAAGAAEDSEWPEPGVVAAYLSSPGDPEATTVVARGSGGVSAVSASGFVVANMGVPVSAPAASVPSGTVAYFDVRAQLFPALTAFCSAPPLSPIAAFSVSAHSVSHRSVTAVAVAARNAVSVPLPTGRTGSGSSSSSSSSLVATALSPRRFPQLPTVVVAAEVETDALVRFLARRGAAIPIDDGPQSLITRSLCGPARLRLGGASVAALAAAVAAQVAPAQPSPLARTVVAALALRAAEAAACALAEASTHAPSAAVLKRLVRGRELNDCEQDDDRGPVEDVAGLYGLTAALLGASPPPVSASSVSTSPPGPVLLPGDRLAVYRRLLAPLRTVTSLPTSSAPLAAATASTRVSTPVVTATVSPLALLGLLPPPPSSSSSSSPAPAPAPALTPDSAQSTALSASAAAVCAALIDAVGLPPLSPTAVEADGPDAGAVAATPGGATACAELFRGVAPAVVAFSAALAADTAAGQAAAGRSCSECGPECAAVLGLIAEVGAPTAVAAGVAAFLCRLRAHLKH